MKRIVYLNQKQIYVFNMSSEKVNLKIQQQKSWMVKETKVGGTKSQEKTKRNICIEND